MGGAAFVVPKETKIKEALEHNFVFILVNISNHNTAMEEVLEEIMAENTKLDKNHKLIGQRS